MWQEVERRGEKVFHKSRCCFRNKRSSLSPASRCVMLPGRYPDCSEGIVYFVKKREKKPTGNCLFMFCFVFFRFIFRQRGMTGNLNTIEKKPVVVKLSALVSFFRAQSSSSSPCVCARPSKCQQYTRQTVRHAQGEDGADVSTSIIDPFLPSVSHQGPSVLCVCAPREKTMCAVFILGRPTQNEGR